MSAGFTPRCNMRPPLLTAALLQMICHAAASNATSRRRRLIAERVALPKPGTGSALEELTTRIAIIERELGRARESAAANSKELTARIDAVEKVDLARRFERSNPVDATVTSSWRQHDSSRPPVGAARRNMAGSVRRSHELPSLHRLEVAAQERAAKVVVGNESVCVAVPCAPKHWPLMPRLMRSVAQQSLAPHKVIVALSHTDSAACAAKQAELSVIYTGALLHCIGGAGWTRGKNRNLAAMACGNVSLAAHLLTYLLTSALTYSTYSLTTAHDGSRVPTQVSIIAYIDADDQMSSRRLEIMVLLMRQHRAHLGLHSYTEVHAHQHSPQHSP